jgi:hypothetical protein
MKTPAFFTLLLAFFPLAISFAQGCSDAGVCSLNAFKPRDENPSSSHLKVGLTNGLADYDIAVFGAYLEYGKQFNEQLGMDIRLGALGQSGNDVSVFGLSDIYLNGTYALNDKSALALGVKIPLSLADRTQYGLALPMDYQSSLGTIDLLLGFRHSFGRLQFMAGYQQPLTDNDNAFFAEAYPASSKLREIQTTNQFQRMGDVLLRFSYPLKLNQKWSITPSILPIYHLGEDQFTNASGKQQAIKGSDGFTLNGNVFVDCRIGEKGSLQLSLATPFVVRETRPDGLTRAYVAGLEYQIRF